jgi:Protein of unknown function (DUF2934)
MFDRKAPEHQKPSPLPLKSTPSHKPSRPAEVVLSHQEISQRAYELYERAGRQDGRDQRDWFTAEREMLAGRK